MTQKKPCIRCLMEKLAAGDGMDELIRRRLESIPEDQLADETEYQKRLECCGQCGQQREGTCGLCGCFVRLRAARSARHCPKTPAEW